MPPITSRRPGALATVRGSSNLAVTSAHIQLHALVNRRVAYKQAVRRRGSGGTGAVHHPFSPAKVVHGSMFFCGGGVCAPEKPTRCFVRSGAIAQFQVVQSLKERLCIWQVCSIGCPCGGAVGGRRVCGIGASVSCDHEQGGRRQCEACDESVWITGPHQALQKALR